MARSKRIIGYFLKLLLLIFAVALFVKLSSRVDYIPPVIFIAVIMAVRDFTRKN